MNTLTTDKELSEIIAKVHESIEGRYDLDGLDLHNIQALLCKLQYPVSNDKQSEELQKEVEGLNIDIAVLKDDLRVTENVKQSYLAALEKSKLEIEGLVEGLKLAKKFIPIEFIEAHNNTEFLIHKHTKSE